MVRVLLFMFGLVGFAFRLRAGVDGLGALVGTVLHLAALLALAGWMLRRPFYKQGFWKACFFVYSFFMVLFAVMLSVVLFVTHNGAALQGDAFTVLLLTALFQLPLLAGLYLYAYRSRDIWARAPA